MAHKTFLFVQHRAPYGNGVATDMLEVALIAAAFDQIVHLVFLDDGVFQLLKHQRPQALGIKPFDYAELGDAEIEAVWIERESLEERGLRPEDLVLSGMVMDRGELAHRMAVMDVVVSA